jgi:hypothetical protein
MPIESLNRHRKKYWRKSKSKSIDLKEKKYQLDEARTNSFGVKLVH